MEGMFYPITITAFCGEYEEKKSYYLVIIAMKIIKCSGAS